MAKDIEQAISEIQDDWMSVDGIIGVGSTVVGGQPVILVIVERYTPSIRKKIPAEYKGFNVKMMESGEISIQNSD